MKNSSLPLFLDIEYNPVEKKIRKIGYVFGDEQGNDLRRLRELVQEARYVVGHNLLAHDLPILTAELGIDFSQLLPVDTLFWSVLLRPERESHRHDKDYFFETLNKPDPVFDCLLCKDLLASLLDGWRSLPAKHRSWFVGLLGHRYEALGFLELSGETMDADDSVGEDSVCAEAVHLLGKRACLFAPWHEIVQQMPIEAGMAAVLILKDKPELITPSWMLEQFPLVEKVLTLLRTTPCGKENCPWCMDILSPLPALKRHFGFPAFRRFEGDADVPLQQRAVEAALKDESILTIFPTGGGKSLTFQLPALIRGEARGALTVVISPLVSLMKDQVDGLNNKEIHRSATLNSLHNPLERREVIDRVEGGQVWILYISPEMLRSSTIHRLFMRRMIDRFVIDEAHCFSAWGQDFRPDYGYIGKLIRKLQEKKHLKSPIPVSCFTATARLEVVEDIHAYFKETANLDLQDYSTSEKRKNLSYTVSPAKSADEKFDRLLAALDQKPGPAIVFVGLVKRTTELCERLKTRGIHALPYNGKMDPEQKKVVQNAFIGGECDIIVATSAFGMGVDKDNVQLVIHYDISPSLENYMQEAGRAGRDPNLQAKCIILYDENDLNEHFNMIQGMRLTQKEINLIWRAIKEYRALTIVKSAQELARDAGWDSEFNDLETQVKSAINALEQVGFLDREVNRSRIFANSLIPRTFDEASSILRNHVHLFGERLDQAFDLARSLYGKQELDVDEVQMRLDIPKEDIAYLVDQFREIGILADEEDILAKADFSHSPKNAQAVFVKYHQLEKEMCAQLEIHAVNTGDQWRVSLKEWNTSLAGGDSESRIPMMRLILEDWFYTRQIEKTKLEGDLDLMQISLKAPLEYLQKYIETKGKLGKKALEAFQFYQKTRPQSDDKLVSFSVLGLKKKIETEDMFLGEQPLLLYHQMLLFLHRIKAIEITKGFIVFANRMIVKKREVNNRRQFNRADYKTLETHYQSKIEQVHIVGEFAKRMVQQYLSALKFSSDYFSLPYDEFLRQYFPGSKRTEIKRALTPEKFDQIFGKLSTEQQEPVKDIQHERILVSAGPGSGKTRVLVHKMANLILLEDMKPQQFLMLAFSRPAVQEFKTRLRELAGGISKYIEIKTYHGFAFSLLGKTGSLEKSETVISSAVKAIQEETAPMEKIKSRTILMLDEFQDISKEEYTLIEAIIEKAEDIRIIAAGDDDQSIYDFRGGSVQFMRKLVNHTSSISYFLTKNYRARPKLVSFSNAFLRCFREDRMKAGQLLLPNRKESSEIRLIKYDSPGLLVPFSKAIQNPARNETTAILTGTNEEALIMATLLRDQGMNAQFIASRDDFDLRNLAELRRFQAYIFQKAAPDSGEIPENVWEKAVGEARFTFSKSTDWPLVERILTEFDRSHPHKSRFEWKEYMEALRLEDFYPPEKGKIYVSTMHKAKGKEFNHVYLLVDGFQITQEDQRKAIYVAITRAMDSLEIHTHQPIFDFIQDVAVTRLEGSGAGLHPGMIELSASLGDVVLSHFSQPQVIETAEKLFAGDRLWFAEGEKYHRVLLPHSRSMAACFSQKFTEVLHKWMEKGYAVTEAKVAHVVYWRDKDAQEGTENKVVLPLLRLEKQENAARWF